MRPRRSWPRCARCSRRTRSCRAIPRRSSIQVAVKTLRLCRRVFFALLVPWAAAAAQDSPYLAQLVERARELKLAQRPEWRKLLHYEPDLLGPGVHGLLDNRAFYNSPRGKADPRAELEATLAVFFSSPEKQCAFIARRSWLDQQ